MVFDEKTLFWIAVTHILSKLAPFTLRGLQVNTGLSFCLETQICLELHWEHPTGTLYHIREASTEYTVIKYIKAQLQKTTTVICNAEYHQQSVRLVSCSSKNTQLPIQLRHRYIKELQLTQQYHPRITPFHLSKLYQWKFHVQQSCDHIFCFKSPSEGITYRHETDHKQKPLWKIKTLECNYFIFHCIWFICIRV